MTYVGSDSVNFYGGDARSIGYPPVSSQKNGAEAAAAADFERILQNPAPVPSAPVNSAASPEEEKSGHSFLDFIKAVIDIFNPLQHIPVVSAIYRHLTGDEISPAAKLAGDTLYGGFIGGAVALADIAFEKITGNDVGETVIAGLTGGEKDPAESMPATLIAQNLNAVSPAAGHRSTININEIIWSTDALRPDINLGAGTATGRSGPDINLGAGTARAAPASPPAMAALPVPEVTAQSATAPVTDINSGAVAPDQIAFKMMQALDKYAAMNRPALVSTVSATH